MNTLIISILLAYLATCFIFHQAMLQCYAEDDDPELERIPTWFIKTGLLVGSLVWPLVVLGSWIYKVVKG